MKKLATIALFTLIFSACTGAPEGEKESTEPIKIGLIGPLTGDAASYGSDVINGAKIAVEEINSAGGINGRQISLIAEDARCTGGDAVSAAQKLINIDKVDVIAGGQCSGETLAAAPIAEAAQIVMMSAVSSSPDITNAGDFVFRVYPSDALKGAALSNYFDSKGYTKIAMISENTDFCIGIQKVVTESAAKSGGEVVFDELVEPGTKDYRSLITRLKDMDFDVFLVNSQSDATGGAMVQQIREMGIEKEIVGTDTLDSISLGQIMSEAMEGAKVLSVPSLSASDPKGGPFVQKFTEKYGNAQSTMFFAALSYESIRLLAGVMADVGTDGPAIRDALYNHSGHDSIVGTMTFDEFGDVKGIPYALKEFQDGELVEVERIPLN
jgi:branched-chain amino acid transport system substrate-binding protein